LKDAPEDFVGLFEREFERLARNLRAVDAAADDAVQEAFVEALSRWNRVGKLDDPAGWVRRVAVNRLLNARRSRRRQEVAVERLSASIGVVDHPVGQPDVLDAVRRLPRQQRIAIALYYGRDLSVSEVADAMNLTSGAVKFHLHAGRNGLRELLEAPAHG
jgi:RNA polymerase sigma factor (sigma-70 family)